MLEDVSQEAWTPALLEEVSFVGWVSLDNIGDAKYQVGDMLAVRRVIMEHV